MAITTKQKTVEGIYVEYSQCMRSVGRFRKTLSSVTIMQNNGEKIRIDIWKDKIPSIKKGDRLRATGTFRKSHWYGDHLKGKALEVLAKAETK